MSYTPRISTLAISIGLAAAFASSWAAAELTIDQHIRPDADASPVTVATSSAPIMVAADSPQAISNTIISNAAASSHASASTPTPSSTAASDVPVAAGSPDATPAISGLASAPASMSATSTETAAALDPRDPYEHINRKIYHFNDVLDRHILLPVATAYNNHVPRPVHAAITRFFINLRTPWTAVNNLLQGHPGRSIESLSTFVINTTTSLGFFDLAGYLGIEKSSADFGQTLGVWGMGPGPYIMLPFAGPSTVRDTAGSVVNIAGSPTLYINNNWSWPVSIGLTATRAVDSRANLIGVEHLIDGDQYTLIRDAYLQNRQYEINGQKGNFNPNNSFGNDDGFGDDPAKSGDNTPPTTKPSESTTPAPQAAPANPATAPVNTTQDTVAPQPERQDEPALVLTSASAA